MSSTGLKSVVLAGALAVAMATPSMAFGQGTPNQRIDASTDPDAAAQAIASGPCAVAQPDPQACSFRRGEVGKDGTVTPVDWTVDYGPPTLLGDVLYNCSTTSYAEAGVGFKDTRGQSFSLSEKVSVKIELGFMGLASSSAEFSAFSKQQEATETSVNSSLIVPVAPLYKGWTVYRVNSIVTTGSAYITDGIKGLIAVDNIDLSFPGYSVPGTPDAGTPVLPQGVKIPMTDAEITDVCGADTIADARALKAARATHEFKVRLCGRSAAQCTSRRALGSLPARIRSGSEVSLRREGKTWAEGRIEHGRLRLTTRRSPAAGSYKLTIRERAPRAQPAGATPMRSIKTMVPIRFR